MSKIMIETVDEIRGDGKATGRKLVRIGRAEDVAGGNTKGMIVLGAKKLAIMLELLESADLRSEVIGQGQKIVAINESTDRPDATLEWNGDTYAIFHGRTVKKLYYRKDNPMRACYRITPDDCPIRPAHFTGGTPLPLIQEKEKGTPGRKPGTSATALLQAEMREIREAGERREAMMMEMLRTMQAAK